MTRDDLIDNEVADKLSKEVVSYIIEQITKWKKLESKSMAGLTLKSGFGTGFASPEGS